MAQPPSLYGHLGGQQSHQSLVYPPNSKPSQAISNDVSHLDNFGNSVASTASYDQNASRIPGLGFSGSSMTQPFFLSESPSGWPSGSSYNNQQMPSITHPQPFPSDPANTPNFHNPPYSAGAPEKGQDDPLEEGELSDDQFEDLYEPQETLQINDPIPPPNNLRPHLREDSVGDADGSSIYDTGTPREEGAVDSTSISLPTGEHEASPDDAEWEPSYPERARSGSYSPYLSPREIRQDAGAPKPPAIDASQVANTQTHLISTQSKTSLGVVGSSSENHVADVSTNNHNYGTSTPFKSVSEAKIKAQEAILGLWPLKIRYQNYIEEGFDEKLIEHLFTDLGLDISRPKPPQSSTLNTESKSIVTGADRSEIADSSKPSDANPTQSEPVAFSETQNMGSVDGALQTKGSDAPQKEQIDQPKSSGKSAAEERKDKIARKLAAKAQKTATQQSAAAANATASTTDAKARTKIRNTELLHQKLAALKKAREEAAKAAAAQKELSQVTTSNTPGPVSSPPQKGLPLTSTMNDPASQDLTPDAASTFAPASLSGPLAVPESSTNSSVNRSSKRPVASDFDTYSSHTPLKRTRMQETLIIEVSDDEDVEMEIGSPVDAPDDSMETDLPRHGALGSYPPLSSGPNWRQRSRPSSAAHTPPDHELKATLLEQQIADMHRKIAEAEAKKKRPNGAQTPVLYPDDEEPRRLPKVAEVAARAQKLKLERRDRIASHELPRVEASLMEKQDRLHRLKAEAAQIELELRTQLAERQRLTAEMDDLQVPMDEEFLESVDEPDSTRSTSVTNIVSAEEGALDDADDDSTHGAAVHDDMSDPDIQADARLQLNSIVDEVTSGEGTEPLPEETVQDNTIIRNEEHAAQPIINEPTELPDPNVENSLPRETNDITMPDADLPASTTDALTIESSSGEGSASDEEPFEPLPAQISSISESQVPGASNDIEVPDEDPYEPSPAQPAADVLDGSAEDNGEVNPGMTDLSQTLLLPYSSPLKYFHSYIYHPKFFDDVPGGLKSLTYSLKIDPSRPICPFSLAGEQCPHGVACEYQHFENMAIPDTEIITQLGSSDKYNGERRIRFIDGLKQVLNDLKTNKVKDFDRITRAILKYRSDFNDDKTKILPLDGVSI